MGRCDRNERPIFKSWYDMIVCLFLIIIQKKVNISDDPI